MSNTAKSPQYAKRQAEREAVNKARAVEPYLERQARRAAVPPLQRQVRESVPYLERQAARAADGARKFEQAAERSAGTRDA